MTDTAQTAVEKAWSEANKHEHGGAGFHLTFTFPDGSFVDAPPFEVGPNWARLDELTDGPFMLDVTDAEVAINWNPGPAQAYGPRFPHIDKRPMPAAGR